MFLKLSTNSLILCVFISAFLIPCNVTYSFSFAQYPNLSDILKNTGSQFEDSPLVSELELKDFYSDAMYINPKTNISTNGSLGGPIDLDISSVNYFSDGNFLTAILWGNFPLAEKSTHFIESYGINFDSDFDIQTGNSGIDYGLRIIWDNSTQNWYKILGKWSSSGENVQLSRELLPFKNFTSVEGDYVVLSMDLETILSPQKYKVMFFATYSESKNDSLISDFTRWVALPPPSITLTPSETFVSLRPGESKGILLNFNSTPGYQSIVNLSYIASPEISIFINPSHFTIPSSGMISLPVTLHAMKNISYVTAEPIQFLANTTFVFPQPAGDPSSGYYINTNIRADSVIQTSNIVVQNLEPYTNLEQLHMWFNNLSTIWSANKEVIILIIGIFLTPFGAWAFNKFVKKPRRERKRTTQNKL